jgi:hypothetical protein
MYASSITTAERNGHSTTFQETEPENGYPIGRPDTITGYRQQNTKISLERKGHFAGFEVMFFKELNGQQSSFLNFFVSGYYPVICEGLALATVFSVLPDGRFADSLSLGNW